MTRRQLAHFLFALPIARFFQRLPAAASTSFEVDRLLTATPALSLNLKAPLRHYRADAVISLLTLPVFSRASAGIGFAACLAVQQGETSAISMQFGAGSLPEHTRGVNKLGYMQEVVLEKGSLPQEAAYFGFMTSSPEENIQQGKASLSRMSGRLTHYAAIDGNSSPARSQSTQTKLRFPSLYNFSHCQTLIGEVRNAFHSAAPAARRTAVLEQTGPRAPFTFLYALRRAIQSREVSFEAPYICNGKRHRLLTERNADPKQRAHFAARGLTARPDRVTRIRGIINTQQSVCRTAFKIWIEGGPDAVLPLRIEFQTRSFLKLALKADPTISFNSMEVAKAL